MLNIEAIKKELSSRLDIPIEELNREINEIINELGLDVIAAIVEFISRRRSNQNIADFIEILRLGALLRPIKELKAGIRGVNVIGRVESIRIFNRASELKRLKLIALILINDGTSYAQAYVYSAANLEVLNSIKVGDILILENVIVSDILANSIPKLTLITQSVIHKISSKEANKYFYKIPELRIYDISDILESQSSSQEIRQIYYHIRGVYLGIISDEVERRIGERTVKILLGDLKTFSRKRIYLLLRRAAIAEFESLGIKPGLILYAHGVMLKKLGNKLYILARNLSSFEIKKPAYIPPRELPDGSYWGYLAQVEDEIKISDYSRGKYANFVAKTMRGDSIRVLVWENSSVAMLENIKGAKVFWIFGKIKQRKKFVELHVSEYYGVISISSEKLLKLPDEHIAIKSTESSSSKVLKKQVLDISSISPKQFIDIIAKVSEVRIIGGEKLAGIVTLSDGIETIKLLIWEGELLEKFLNYKDCLIKITDVNVAKDRRNPQELVLMATRRTKIEKIACGFEYFLKSDMSDKLHVFLFDAKLVPGERAKIYGTIVNIEKLDIVHLCGICGSFIVDYEKGICELGHVGNVVSKKMLFATIDNGFIEIKTLIPIELLGIENINFLDLIDNYVGKNLCLKGKVKVDLSSSVPQRIFLVDSLC